MKIESDMHATIQSIRFNTTAAGVVRAVVTLSIGADQVRVFHLNTYRFMKLGLDEGDVVELDRAQESIVRIHERGEMEDRVAAPLPTECPCCDGDLDVVATDVRHQLVCLDCKGRSAMINDVEGSMLKLAPKGSVVIIPVNTVGVHGRGMALYMRQMYKHALSRFVRVCSTGRINVGPMEVVEDGGFHIALFPTKYDWRNKSCPLLIRRSAERLRHYLDERRITECHLPRVGCGRGTGGLSYPFEVRPILDEVFANSGIQVNVYDWD